MVMRAREGRGVYRFAAKPPARRRITQPLPGRNKISSKTSLRPANTASLMRSEPRGANAAVYESRTLSSP